MFTKYRKEAGLTQTQLAVAIGKSPRTIQAWESGETMPELPPPLTLMLCHLLRITLEQLAEIFPLEEAESA
jgi:DNA-binding XRE family transcriptional regulator